LSAAALEPGQGVYLRTCVTRRSSPPRAVRLNLGDALGQPLGDEIGERHEVLAVKLVKLRNVTDYLAFITNAARRISTVGGSLRDVQLLAGHSALSTTQRYIEAHADAQRRVVELV